MKICYGLLVFNKYDQIVRLVKTLCVNGNEIIFHVDKKSEELYQKLIKLYSNNPKIHFTKTRIKIFWGDITQVKALNILMKESLNFEYDYFTILSESCLPLYPDSIIKKFLYEHNGNEFIDVRFDWTKRARLHLKHKPYTPWQQKHRNILAFKDVVLDLLFGWIIGKHKQFSSFKVPTTTTWFTATKGCVKYITNSIINNKIIDKYKDTFCPDEHVVAEIIYNSPYYQKLIHPNLRGNNLVYCDWFTLKAPKTLTIKDYDKIYHQKYPTFYARKFDCKVDKQIVDKIYQNRENDNFKYPS